MIVTTHRSANELTVHTHVTRRTIGRRTWGHSSRQDIESMSLRERQTKAFATVYGGGASADMNHHRAVRRDATLTPEQLWLVYVMCGDVRAAVDSIARRVSTQTWRVQPTVEPDDPLYPDAVAQAAAVTAGLRGPSPEDDWRTFCLKVTIDALVFWHGAIEKVFASTLRGQAGFITELGTPHGPTIHPDVTSYGRWVGYTQDMQGGSFYYGPADDRNQTTRLTLDQIALLRLTPNTRSPYPVPIIETIVREVTTLVRASERTMYTMDRHEIPTGFLVLTGTPPDAVDEVEDGLANKAGRDDKVRVIHSMNATAPAQWLRIQETFKEVEYAPVIAQTQNVIWRNFGVNRVEMGETEGNTKTSSQAQIEIGDSHLIEPLLEAWASLANRHLVPAYVARWERSERKPVLCEFVFADEQDLTPEEELDRANAVRVRIESAQSTINEERKLQGKPPVENGDVLRLKDGANWVDVGVVRDGDASAEDDDETPDDDPPNGTDGNNGQPSDDGDDAGDDGERHRCGDGCSHDDTPSAAAMTVAQLAVAAEWSRRARRAAELFPSDWQSPGRFDGYRTLDLRALFDVVLAYGSEVDPLWQQARSAAVAAVAAAYRADRLDGTELRTRLGEIVEELRVGWSLSTLKHYETAAGLGADAAREFTEFSDMGQDTPERAALYHGQAMAYLDALMSDLQVRMLRNITAALQAQEAEEERADHPEVRQEAVEHALLTSVERTWDANEHRITNWSGKLVELASATMVGLLAWWSGQTDAAPAGEVVIADEPMETERIEPVEWGGLWVATGGPGGDENTCEDCAFESLQGWRPMSAIARYPAGDVRCGARDRCALVVATRSEVEAGITPP